MFMKTIIPVVLTMICICSIVACSDDETGQSNVECINQVHYISTNVCFDGANAAAIKLEDSGFVLIMENFFDFVSPDEVEEGTTLMLSYENVDSSLYNSGALCGPLIVAPIASVTCLEVE